ncbi:hypothetical protein MJG53_006460 [Ovis ammon polii x Ovis aries]|uniref:Uncharacterized protein n=1 Tax=Ovis ammon polii x Ovis aries TaxID=2918886 RepID=A0ACB9V4T7_9CETA|nr:hypothetical protein MJG53_006460 [Ovis ammon polii x Ovis aries]
MGNRSKREAARSAARMEGKLYKGQDYKTEFQPQDYLKTFYAFDSGTVAENEILKFNLNNLFETFSPGGIGGDILIDVGTGPTIYQLISACEAFREIIMSDYSELNLREVDKWLKKDPGAYDWSPAIRVWARGRQVPAADCVLSLLALECACQDVDTYQAAIQNLVGLLKPGGHLVTSVALRCREYMVGSRKFFGLSLEKETVEKAVQEAARC